jgi:hypothetical protein
MHEGYNFSADFQDLILASIVDHPDAFSFSGQVLSPDFFSGLHSQATCRALVDYKRQYHIFPTWQVLGNLVVRQLRLAGDQEDSARDAFGYVQKLAEIDTKDYKHVSSQVVNFARERALLNAAHDVVRGVENGKWPESGIVPMFESALSLGTNLQELGTIFDEDYLEVIRRLTTSVTGVKSGWTLLDKIWQNGWAPGWLVVPLAPPKRFKTTCCLNMALNMVSPAQGADVIYYTTEISEDELIKRIMQRVSRRPERDLYFSTKPFAESVGQWVEANRAGAGKLLVKEFPSKSATIADMEAHARAAISAWTSHKPEDDWKSFKPKAIFIDHAETVKPERSAGDRSRQSDWREQADIYTAARAMGSRLGATVIMPDRCNRETVDRPIPSMKSFQGSFEKAGVVDVAFGLCSTDKELLQSPPVVRVFVFLNRHGVAMGYLHGMVDPQTFNMEIKSTLVYTPEDDDDGPAWKKKKRKGGTVSNLPRILTEY